MGRDGLDLRFLFRPSEPEKRHSERQGSQDESGDGRDEPAAPASGPREDGSRQRQNRSGDAGVGGPFQDRETGPEMPPTEAASDACSHRSREGDRREGQSRGDRYASVPGHDDMMDSYGAPVPGEVANGPAGGVNYDERAVGERRTVRDGDRSV